MLKKYKQISTGLLLLTCYIYPYVLERQVTVALSRVVSEIFNVEKRRDLEMGSEVAQGH